MKIKRKKIYPLERIHLPLMWPGFIPTRSDVFVKFVDPLNSTSKRFHKLLWPCVVEVLLTVLWRRASEQNVFFFSISDANHHRTLTIRHSCLIIPNRRSNTVSFETTRFFSLGTPVFPLSWLPAVYYFRFGQSFIYNNAHLLPYGMWSIDLTKG